MGLSALEVVDRVKTVRQMEGVLDLCQMAVRASRLIHELQKERGLSVGLLEGAAAFGDQLAEQRRVTDGEVAVVLQYTRDPRERRTGRRVRCRRPRRARLCRLAGDNAVTFPVTAAPAGVASGLRDTRVHSAPRSAP